MVEEFRVEPVVHNCDSLGVDHGVHDMKLVCAEVGWRLSAEVYSVVELLDRRTGFGFPVDGGGWCVVNPEILVLLHVDRDGRAYYGLSDCLSNQMCWSW